MATADETLHALNEVHGQEKPDDVGIGEWIWGALQGDFNPERSTGQIGLDMVVSLFPVADTICDLRDLCANIRQYRKDSGNEVALFFIATTAIGFFPEAGTVVKSALRLVWVYLKPLIKHADDITNVGKLVAATNRACDAALPKITQYLQHSRIAKWATNGKVSDVFKFVAKAIRELAEKISPGDMRRMLDEKINELKALLQKIRPMVPSIIREQVDDLLKMTSATQYAVSSAIQQFAEPVKIVLKVLAKRLDDRAWRVEIYRTNRGWIAPISESGSAKLINAKPPRWVKKLDNRITYPPLTMSESEAEAMMQANPGYPKMKVDQIATFSDIDGKFRTDTISGPAKLYRIVDPSNEGAGIFWISETEFLVIKNREQWRSRFAVKPEWNQNGWFVEYQVEHGETLPVWRGSAASQELNGTNYFLEGGGEQIVFFPGKRDKLVQAMPRVNPDTGMPVLTDSGGVDRSIEFKDVVGETVPIKLRAEIMDSHIKGPTETGWGAADYQVDEARRILLTVP